MTTPINGNGNFRISNFLSKPQLSGVKNNESLRASEPIKMTGTNTVKREELGLINPYNGSDPAISEARDIASETNKIMADLGFPQFKVSPKTVLSVTDGLNNNTLPELNSVADVAVATRIADPKGPFADLFA